MSNLDDGELHRSDTPDAMDALPDGVVAPDLSTGATVHSEPFFGPLKASLIFVLYIGGQVIGALLAIIGYVAVNAMRGGDISSPSFPGRLMQDSLPAVVIGSLLAAALITYWASRGLAPHLFVGDGRDTLGWRGTTGKWQLIGLAVGVALGLSWIGITVLVPPPDGAVAGPLAKMAAGGGPGRHAWAFAGLIAAPFLEEFVFRGILFAGFARRWGAKVAVVIVTLLFVSLHVPETYHYFPATIGVTTLALVTVAFRIRTGSLVPPILTHMAYNMSIIVAAYLFLD